MKLKVTPYQHQYVMFALMQANESLALFAEMGTGKTLPALMIAAEVAENGEDTLVVCPAAVASGWTVKAKDYFEKETYDTLMKHLHVTSYEKMWRRKEFQREWGCMILDEGHYIKTHSAKRSKVARQIALKSKRRYLLTGTPTSNGQLHNLWSEFCFLDPTPGYRKGDTYSAIWQPFNGNGSYYDWVNHFSLTNKWHQPYKYVNVNDIQTVVANHAYRITKAECLDLPEVLPDEQLTPKLGEKKIYNSIVKESAYVDLDLLCTNSLTRMLALRQICSGFVTVDGVVHELKDTKAKWLKSFLNDFDDKLVVFCAFRHSIDTVEKIMKQAGMNPVVLDGRSKDRGIWQKFQDDPKVKGIVCQYQSGNAGIDLTAASTQLFYEPCLSSNLNQQARDRIHRIGQDSPCTYIYLTCENSIEQSIYQSLCNYQDFSEKFFEENMLECCKGKWKG